MPTASKIETREWFTIDREGEKIFCVLHRPVGCENPPVICTLHGFASNKIGSNRYLVNFAEALALNGFATLRFDFRGAGDSEGSLSSLSLDDLVSDAISVYSFIENIEGIDGSRIGVFGSSLGGSISILSSALYKKIKALVLWAPVASGLLWYRDFLKQHPELVSKNPQEVLGSYRGIAINQLFRQQFGAMDAARALKELRNLPILHMQGENDQTTSLDHQKAFSAGAPHSCHFLSFSETDHWLGHQKRLPEIMQQAITWFKTHL